MSALISHECGPGSIPRLGVVCGLSLLLLLCALRGFLSGTKVPSPQKPSFDLFISIYSHQFVLKNKLDKLIS